MDTVEYTACGQFIKVKQEAQLIFEPFNYVSTKYPKSMLVLFSRKQKKKRKSKSLCECNLHQITVKKLAKKKMKLEASGSQHKKITGKIAGVLRHDFQPFFVKDSQFKFNKNLNTKFQDHSDIPRVYK